METARLMLETARAMRTYTTTQVAPLLDQERAKAERSVQNMEQVLDVQMPAALQKALPRLPAAKEQRILQITRQQLANSVHPQQNDETEPQFFPQSIPFYAQIVSVPADVALNHAAAAMKTVLIWLAGVFAGLYLIVNAIVFVFISKLVPAPAPQ